MFVMGEVSLLTNSKNLANYLGQRLLQMMQHYLHIFSLLLKQLFYLSKSSIRFKLALSCSRSQSPLRVKPLGMEATPSA